MSRAPRAALFDLVRHRVATIYGCRSPVLARLLRAVLDAFPGPVIDRLRTLPLVAPLLRRAFALAVRPLGGRAVAIAHGPGAGLRLWFDETSAVWVSGRAEGAVQEALRTLVRPGAVLFDVGANVGFFTVLGARLVGPSGTVVAFEPHPENVARLRRNVDLNAAANVVVVAAAVSDAGGERLLDARHTATAHLVGGGAGPGSVRVEAISLDEFVAQRPDLAPAVVKIDVEGHEAEVVRGMRATLGRAGPVLICEVHGRGADLYHALAAAGYATTTLAPDRRASGLVHVLAAPRGHPAVR